ncbi:MAG: 50S ribosomal protein L7/L12 [Candidatus Tectimicrobiota bacterium]|nr:MAG: 50S ribosomal protein L7/L12 [Candidatus Tectomicrobia bacterium]
MNTERAAGEARNAPPRHLPIRTCVGCRAQRPPQELLRLVCSPAGEVMVDRTGRAPGRGAYVCYDAGCLRRAWQAAKLTKALRRPVRVSPFAEACRQVEALLRERLQACLGMAQRARAVVSGHGALSRALAQGTVVYVVRAENLAAPRAAAYEAWCRRLSIPCVSLFTKEELGRCLGKPPRGAVGFTEARFGQAFAAWYARWQRLQCAGAGLEAQHGRSI